MSMDGEPQGLDNILSFLTPEVSGVELPDGFSALVEQLDVRSDVDAAPRRMHPAAMHAAGEVARDPSITAQRIADIGAKAYANEVEVQGFEDELPAPNRQSTSPSLWIRRDRRITGINGVREARRHLRVVDNETPVPEVE